MKKTHIIGLLLIAISVGVIIYVTADFTSYSDFIQAKENPKKVVNIVGYLVKNKELIYNPEKDPNYFSFTMTDKEGNEQPVYYKGSKPQDFERSEQLVVKGKMDGEKFHAQEILMKCPSKYVNDEIVLKEGEPINIELKKN